jgi:hypothetical protein
MTDLVGDRVRAAAELLLVRQLTVIARLDSGPSAQERVAIARMTVEALLAAGVFTQADGAAWLATAQRALNVTTGQPPRGLRQRLEARSLDSQATASSQSSLKDHAATQALRFLDSCKATQQAGTRSEQRPVTPGPIRRVLAPPQRRMTGVGITVVELAERAVVLHCRYKADEHPSEILWELALRDDVGTEYAALLDGMLATRPPGPPDEYGRLWSGTAAFTPAVPPNARWLELLRGARLLFRLHLTD